MRRVFWGGVLLLSVGVLQAAVAEDRPASAAEPSELTEAWLQLQRGGGAASPQEQRLTPAERELAMERWLGSFKHEIPEFYEQDMAGEIGR